MSQFLKMLASYGRVVLATSLTAIMAMGHLPEVGSDWATIG